MKESLDEWNRIIQVIVIIITNNSRVGPSYIIIESRSRVSEFIYVYACFFFFLILKQLISLISISLHRHL